MASFSISYEKKADAYYLILNPNQINAIMQTCSVPSIWSKIQYIYKTGGVHHMSVI